jgi:hypothetical protein
MTKKPKPKKAPKRKVKLKPRKPGTPDNAALLAAIKRDPAVFDTILALKCHDVLTKGDTFPAAVFPLLLARFIVIHEELKNLAPRGRGGQTSNEARGMAMMIDGLGMSTAKAARAISEETGISPEAAIQAYLRFRKKFPLKK